MDINELVKNDFFQSVALPLLLAILVAFLEYALNQIRRVGATTHKLRIWVKEDDNASTSSSKKGNAPVVTGYVWHSIQEICNYAKLDNIIEIEILPERKIKPESFDSLGINIMTIAITVDLASLINAIEYQQNPSAIILLLIFHLFVLIFVFFCRLMSVTSPPLGGARRYWIIVSLFSAISSTSVAVLVL